jgi:hypothetical protein
MASTMYCCDLFHISLIFRNILSACSNNIMMLVYSVAVWYNHFNKDALRLLSVLHVVDFDQEETKFWIKQCRRGFSYISELNKVLGTNVKKYILYES